MNHVQAVYPLYIEHKCCVPNCNEYKQICNNQKLKTYSMHRKRSGKEKLDLNDYTLYVPDPPAFDKRCSTSALCTIQRVRARE